MTARRAAPWPNALSCALVGCAVAALLVQAFGWAAAIAALWQRAEWHVPRVQSALVLALGLLVLRSADSPRRRIRRLVVAAALAAAFASFIQAPLPASFEGNVYMTDGVENAGDREKFERRFPNVRDPVVKFHSHLGDVLMGTLDRTFGGSGTSTARAYAWLSRLGGLLFLVELLAIAGWHRFSRKVCRYVGLALASPLALLYFGYYELGYLAMSAGVVPLLAVQRRPSLEVSASTLAAGFLQGLHAALHGFGLLGLAGGALRALVGRGPGVHRLVSALTFASAGVAMYAGWTFIYIAIMKMSIVIDNAIGGFALRRLFDLAVYDRRIAYPVLSFAGIGEIGLISALAGAPLLALGAVRSSWGAVVPAAAYALPGLLFLIAWWPPGAPYNLDLIMAAFPGLFAACWLSAGSRRRATYGLLLLLCLHMLFWANLGSTVFDRIWVAPAG